MGNTPQKGADRSPRKKAAGVDDAARTAVRGASESNPTGKAPPKEEKAEGCSPKRSQRPRNKSPWPQDKRPVSAVPLPMVPESSGPIVEGAERASDEKRCKCNHVITESAMETIALHWSKRVCTCSGCRHEAQNQNNIGRVRPEKSDLLTCVECYHHLCCGVGSIAYPFGHSRKHCVRWGEQGHWFAILYRDPERGYCFKCNVEVPMAVKYADIVSQKLLALPPSAGQTEAEINPKKLEMTGKVQAEKWPSDESRSSDAQGYAIRGIPNRGKTCYMSAVLQCLFVLGKLQERMLALDHPKSTLGEALKKLFVEASAAGDELDPNELLDCVKDREQRFSVGIMGDSHELLLALRNMWNEGEEVDNRQSDALTVIDSIFRFEMARTISCKKCGYSSPGNSEAFWDLKLDFPLKWHPTRSAASPETSESQIFPADVLRNFEQMQIVSGSGYPRVIGSEVTVEEAHKPLEVDSTQAQRISQSKEVAQSPLQILEGKSVDSLTEDSMLIEDLLLLLFSEGQIVWTCPNCPKDHEEPSTSESKNGEQIVRRGKEDDVADSEPTSYFRLTTLPPVLTLHLNRTSKLEGEGTPMVENMVDNIVGTKISGHVRFKEYLDVDRFRYPSCVDTGSTLYRLAGVVEHIGKGPLKDDNGHYIAYVRARRLENQQEGTWFCADDCRIEQVTLEQVLNCEAFMLFYERMEDQDISGIRRQN